MEQSSQAILKLLETIPDPEVPAINIVELGIIRAVQASGDSVQVTVTPTYSGCPAMAVIEREIGQVLKAAGFKQVEIKTVYAPAWTTDWISEEARQKLKIYGIAPPAGQAADQLVPFPKKKVVIQCPFCDSANTEKSAEFGATACKALYFCKACSQPFEYFKAF